MADALARARSVLEHWQRDFMAVLSGPETRASFWEDAWSYPQGGGGLSCVLSDGDCIEKAGVNFSHIQGDALPASASATRPHLAGCPFSVVGVSTVVHPLNPYVPTCHANARYFEVDTSDGLVWWFGGGYDLTPYYGFEADCRLWHVNAKASCDAYRAGSYARFKKACDEYFYLPHREEARGIGGIFFDDLSEGGFDVCLDFINNMTEGFCSAYQAILEKRHLMSWGDRERKFQMIRRGRYVEFNLLYDRGTLFGLQSKGRTESILMSLPPHVQWAYQWQPEAGSPEAELTEKYLPVRDWVE